ncbi:hypothetical protein A0J61_02165 [Choanephora cucurbitarum]|uniref:Uncharacterized protein n=1 Tax=Choanephora cucurbitarum TaxID=101091 RepID=A0A1C7NLC8_9FUNG|nr:hypothetical protein A0J61_02165 [Choanephora cucurbitarum]
MLITTSFFFSKLNSLTNSAEFKLYLKKNYKNPSLTGWIKEKLICFLDHDSFTITTLENTIKDFASKLVEGHEFEISVDEQFLKRVFRMNKFKPTESNSDVVFFSLSENKDVDQVWSKVKRTIENVEQMKTTNPAAQLDIMATKLMRRYDNISANELVALKLAISHIIDLMDDDLLAVYKASTHPIL